MHPTAKTHNNDILSRDEGESDGEKEILPDTTVGILRRMAEEIKCPICLGTMERPMSTRCNHTFCHECILHALSRSDGCPLCKAHVHKRGLNKVDHLEQVIEAFNELKDAFEQEGGFTLSQAPRHYDAEPQENLTQLYPYPEKTDESSSSKPVVIPIIPPSARAATAELAFAHRQPSNHFTASPSTQSTLPEQSQQLEEIEVPSDMDCFDVDLDSVSADQAARLAEKMLAMISLGPPSESFFSSTAPSASSSRSINRSTPQSNPLEHKTVVKQESDEDEEDDDPTQPRQEFVQVKDEPSSSLEDSTSLFNSPTPERASKETSVVICGTYLTPQKKDPPLFTNFEFQLAGTFVTPTREEMELMVKAGGGTIVPKFFQRDRSAVGTNSDSTIRHVLLYDQASDGVMSLKKLRSEIESTQLQGLSMGKKVSVVPCKNLLDCISRYDMGMLVESIPF
ncbi:hypothetical protein EC991_006721 [Linnemannia zychae]|nr:hypothetical protein EC991_006721 [Linnemannia zychae]